MSDDVVNPSDSALGRSTSTGEGRVFPCERCGADLTFNIGAQRLKCEFCGFEKDLEVSEQASVAEQDLGAMLRKVAERRQRAAPAAPSDAHEIRCDACGANTAFEGTLTSQSCAYCGAPMQRGNVHDAADRIPVDGVLPFAVENERAKQNLRAWVGSRWFAPNEFKKRGILGNFEGVYMPYFTYDAMTTTAYRGERGEHYYVTVGTGDNRRQERRTRWSSASGQFQRFFDDVAVPAISSLPSGLLTRLEPWPFERCLPFTRDALAGKLAHTYDVEVDACFSKAKSRIESEIVEEVHDRIGGDEQRVHSIRTQYAGLTYKHLLLPLWLLAYRMNEKSYRVVVNAVTGEVQGERPYSVVKIAFAVIVALGLLIAAWVATQK